MKHLFLPVLLLAAGVVNAQLLTEDFESYAVGDYIAVSGQPAGIWSTWTSGAEGTVEDAQVSNEVAQSGTQSLKLFGGLAGGPMDILLIAGLEGSYDVTFSMFVPEGNSGYYNVQESTVPATAWAFECYLNGNGTVNYNIDGGAFVLDATYATNEWLTITHHIDTDNDLMNIYFNGEYQGQLPFDGAEIGAINFFAAGDGITTPTYYIDDLLVDVTDEVLAAGCTDDSACNFDAAAGFDDGSCEFPGDACDDGDASTTNDVYNDLCECAGEVSNVEEAGLNFSFGPNPAQQGIFLQAGVPQAKVRILSLDGKVVSETMHTNLQAGTFLSFNLNNGLYFVELFDGANRTTQRLVVQK